MAEQPPALKSTGQVPVCVIGTSAGGVTALQKLFQEIPDDLGLAYIVALHLAPDHPSLMHELLASHSRMPVHRVKQAIQLQPDHVYVISPQQDLVIEGDRVVPHQTEDEPRPHAPIDRLFYSVATSRIDGIAVVMTGAGSDGTRGVRAIQESGGIVVVQDPDDAEYPTMPQNAIGTGAVDFIERSENLAKRIADIAATRHAVRSIPDEKFTEDVQEILAFLRARTGHDFAGYKKATVLRRIKRRVQICRKDTVGQYAAFLRENAGEPRKLFADLLIAVTSFFRDAEAFDALSVACVRPLVASAEGEIRVWDVGCSSGEEAYSLAILFLEEAERSGSRTPVQIFATDLDEVALSIARAGCYPRSIAADVSAGRLESFFVDEGTHYRVTQELRDMVLFATHSLIREPPFTRLDLLVCRNLMIYLERQLQHQATSIFHYALKSGGYLFLGPAEMPDMSHGLFDAVDRDARIYQGRAQAHSAMPMLPRLLPISRGIITDDVRRPSLPRLEAGSALTTVHLDALEASAPPSILIDTAHNVVSLSPSAGRFILLPGGPLNERLPAIVRPELRGELMIALDRAFNRRMPSLTRSIGVRFESEDRLVSMHVAVVAGNTNESRERLIVYFLDAGPVAQAAGEDEAETQQNEIHRLHEDLSFAQEAVLISRAEHEGSLQDLRIANEELQSLNEEYRSTAEELETSKEELQSINEELHTVNFELKSKIDIVSSAHNDLLNLTAASEIGTLFLDADLKIRMFTPPVRDIYNISEADVGRSITDFAHRLTYHTLEDDVHGVLRKLAPIEEEIQGPDGKWFLVRIRPYRTTEDKVSGAVVTFNDITDRQRIITLKENDARYHSLLSACTDIVFRMSADWSEMLRLEGRGIVVDTLEPSRSWMATYIDQQDQDHLQAEIDASVRNESAFALEHRIRHLDGTFGWARTSASPMLDAAGGIVEWLGTSADFTARQSASDRLRQTTEDQRRMIDRSPVLLWEADFTGETIVPNERWTAYTGQSKEEVQRFGWLAAVHPDETESVRIAFLDAFAKGRPLERELRLRAADGSYRRFLVRHHPAIEDGKIAGWYGAATELGEASG